MISSSKHIQVKQTTGQSKRVVMSQKAVTDKFDLNDLSIIDLQNAVDELQNRQTVFVDYWTGIIPIGAPDESIWFDSISNELWIKISGEWLELPLSEKSIYIKRTDNTQYAWNGAAMVTLTVPLTKATIEALLTGEIASHTHAADANKLNATKAAVEAFVYTDKQTLAALNIDLATAEVFEKTLTGATAFTISNARNFKPFRLILTGGSLSVPTFTGYTVNWINTSLVTDYVNTVSNVLWCEIRSAGQIYCFWGN